jgi:hypothetical protein
MGFAIQPQRHHLRALLLIVLIFKFDSTKIVWRIPCQGVNEPLAGRLRESPVGMPFIAALMGKFRPVETGCYPGLNGHWEDGRICAQGNVRELLPNRVRAEDIRELNPITAPDLTLDRQDRWLRSNRAFQTQAKRGHRDGCDYRIGDWPIFSIPRSVPSDAVKAVGPSKGPDEIACRGFLVSEPRLEGGCVLRNENGVVEDA